MRRLGFLSYGGGWMTTDAQQQRIRDEAKKIRQQQQQNIDYILYMEHIGAHWWNG